MKQISKLIAVCGAILLALVLQSCSYLPVSMTSWIDAPSKDEG